MLKLYLTGDKELSMIAHSLRKPGFDVLPTKYNNWVQDFLERRADEIDTDYIIVVLSPRVIEVPNLYSVLDAIRHRISCWGSRSEILITNIYPDPMSTPLWLLPDATEICEKVNSQLYTAASQVPWLHIIDLKSFVLERGLKSLHDPRFEAVAETFFAPKADEWLAKHITRYINSLTKPRKKLLALDLDNTLWSGIVGEDGIEGVKPFKDFQKALIKLKESGILLAIVSKNDESTALDAIRTHPDMILKEEDFVTHRINWLNKSINVASIADELNLGMDSFVFFDDSDFERANMRHNLPEITILEVPKDPAYYTRTLIDYQGFDTLYSSSEDKTKTEMYHAEAARKSLETSAISSGEFFRSLKMQAKITLHEDFKYIERIHQLVTKTNQFNLTTKRYTKQQLMGFITAVNTDVYTISLEDSLGESGIVGVVIVVRTKDIWDIDTFILSCRVIGRTLEYAVLRWLIKQAEKEYAAKLILEFVPTAKNNVSREFVEKCFDSDCETNLLSENLKTLPEDFVEVHVD